MDNTKKINFNDTPKWFQICISLLPLISIILIKQEIDNDFYFLYPTGEYILSNGFPVKDILSMHSNMDIIVQQWLSTVIYYFVYSNFGKAGTIALVYLCYIAIYFLMNKLCRIYTDGNILLSTICSFAACVYIAMLFMPTRPQIFTYIIVLVELILLEKYVKTGKTINLIFIPALSVCLINLHCSMWIMLFIFMAPYFVNAIPFKVKSFIQTPCCKLLPLIITAVASVAAAFINPYGYKALLYVFTSVGFKEINSLINEMEAISISETAGILFFIYIAATIVLAFIFKREKYDSRFILLYAGTAVLGLTSYKSVAYFLLVGMPAFSYFLKDLSLNLKITENKEKSKSNRKILILCLLIAISLLGLVLAVFNAPDSNENELNTVNNASTAKASSGINYSSLDNIIDILDKEDEQIILYAGFNNGSYLEFNGYHPYIDGRAELYLDVNNNEFNYIEEYGNLRSAKIYYKDFVNKYKFNYLIVSQGERYLYTSLLHDDDYEIIYNEENEKNNIILFKLKD